MTEIPPPQTEPTEPAAVAPTRSRRRLFIGIAAGIVVVAIVVVGVVLTLGALNTKAVARYTSTSEHYSVMAPGKPTVQKTKIGGLIPTTYTHWTDGNRYYSVSSSLGGFPPSLNGLFLHYALVGALKHAPGVTASDLKSSDVTNAFLRTPKRIKISGEPATEFTFSFKGARTPFHVVFAGHDPLLYLLVFSESADGSDKRFLGSFKYVK